MERINIGLFSIEEYDRTNEEHKRLATIFENDDDFCTYVGSFAYIDDLNHERKWNRFSIIYFAYIGDILIGMVGLIQIHDYPELVIAILPEHRGNHYSKQLYQEYADYVFASYQEYKEIYVSIIPDNIHSIENAQAAGFQQISKYKYVKGR